MEIKYTKSLGDSIGKWTIVVRFKLYAHFHSGGSCGNSELFPLCEELILSDTVEKPANSASSHPVVSYHTSDISKAKPGSLDHFKTLDFDISVTREVSFRVTALGVLSVFC